MYLQLRCKPQYCRQSWRHQGGRQGYQPLSFGYPAIQLCKLGFEFGRGCGNKNQGPASADVVLAMQNDQAQDMFQALSFLEAAKSDDLRLRFLTWLLSQPPGVLEQLVFARPAFLPQQISNWMRMRPQVRGTALNVCLRLPHEMVVGTLGPDIVSLLITSSFFYCNKVLFKLPTCSPSCGNSSPKASSRRTHSKENRRLAHENLMRWCPESLDERQPLLEFGLVLQQSFSILPSVKWVQNQLQFRKQP